jgi:uncharacterized protein (TIGR00290 family)
MNTFISWSGGKESAFSCYKIMRDKNNNVSCFLNMISEDGKQSRAHGISSELLKLQAEAMGIPITQRKTSWNNYEENFKEALRELKNENITAGVFGDIDLVEHRNWVEKVCRQSQIKAILPLWGMKREEIINEFISAGFQAIVVALNSDYLDETWLGRRINKEFVKDITNLGNVDLCGEAGEYHTFITNGPIFKKNINILKTSKVKKGKHWFLDILDYEII